jgi:hypothetical protein
MGPTDPLAGGLLVVALLSFLAGATAPTYHAQERMRGFGRWLLSRIPYEPPAGLSAEEALVRAREAAEGDVEPDEKETAR